MDIQRKEGCGRRHGGCIKSYRLDTLNFLLTYLLTVRTVLDIAAPLFVAVTLKIIS